MVDVNVVTTFFDDTWVALLLVAEVTVGLALDVSRVVPCDVAEAAKQVSQFCPKFRDARSWPLCQHCTRIIARIFFKQKGDMA